MNPNNDKYIVNITYFGLKRVQEPILDNVRNNIHVFLFVNTIILVSNNTLLLSENFEANKLYECTFSLTTHNCTS